MICCGCLHYSGTFNIRFYLCHLTPLSHALDRDLRAVFDFTDLGPFDAWASVEWFLFRSQIVTLCQDVNSLILQAENSSPFYQVSQVST